MMRIHWTGFQRRFTLVVLLAALTTACNSNPGPRSTTFVIDTSGSIPTDVRHRIEEEIARATSQFVEAAAPGDTVNLYWLIPSETSAYPAARKTWTVPPMSPPAYRSRKVSAEKIKGEIADALQGLPRNVQQTPLLETVYYASATAAADHHWSLAIFSDMRQESEAFRRSTPRGEEPLADKIARMLEISPQVSVPPEKITMYAWPGQSGGSKNVQIFAADRDAFVEFFRKWAPQSTVEVVSLN